MPTRIFRTLNDWLSYIATLHTSRIDLGLQRVESIVIEQDIQRFPYPVIIVAGTNGKGSCVRILESIYHEAGYRVGAYYSPHIHRFNERICVCGMEVEDETLVAAFERVETLRRNRPLSFFEFTTLAALLIFQAADLDILLLEVGLGGRLDAVNMVEPDVSIVTSIGLDHLEWLGKDRETIGFEKAGVYRPGKPAICGDYDPPRRLIQQTEKIGANFFGINKDFSYSVKSNSWNWSAAGKQYFNLPLPTLKCQNAATSLMAVTCLQDRLYVSEKYIKKGIENARLAGRFQVFSKPVKGVLDVAHNPDSASCLADQIKKTSWLGNKKNMAVLGMLKDKDIIGTIKPLLPYIDSWFVGELAVDRTAHSQEIVSYLKTLGFENCYNFCTVSAAFKRAVQACRNSEDHIVAFGSFYTVAEVQKELSKDVYNEV